MAHGMIGDGGEGGAQAQRARPAFAGWLKTTNVVTRQFLSIAARPEIINLAGGLPAPEVYPVEVMADIARDATTKWRHRALGYSAIEDLPELRDAIAAQYSSPHLRLGRDNVLITAGSMQALDLLGKILVEPGDLIVGHYPTYLGAIDAWRPRAPRYRPLRLDPQAPLPSFEGAKFVYAVPNFSNPTGALVDVAARRQLLAAADAADSWLVEDDPYGALVYDGAPLSRLLDLSGETEGTGAHHYGGRVVYLGTLSKTIAPGLRVGWAIAAPDMIEALTLAKQGSDLCTGGLQQVIALEAMDRGLVARQTPFIVDLYRERRDALCAAIEEHLSPWFDWQRPTGGMFVWLKAKAPAIDTDALLGVAFDHGVAYTPSSVFDPSGALKDAVRMNFTLNPPEVLREGVARLGRACAALAAASSANP